MLASVFEKAGSAFPEGLKDISLIACTGHPGLVPSLLVGKTVAKTLARSTGIPLMWIDHIEAHAFANFLERSLEDIRFPAICLTISGGHNELYLWKSLYEYQRIGATMDDASGEAFDKVAKMLNLGYPGGPIVSERSARYRGEFRGIFPEVLLGNDRRYDFSFSGLKSAVKREVDSRLAARHVAIPDLDESTPTGTPTLPDSDIDEICFEFETTVIRTLAKKLSFALEDFGVSTAVLAGGVSANDRLKAYLADELQKIGVDFVAPKKKTYSQDNAAMVAIRAYYEAVRYSELPSESTANIRVT